MTPAEIAGLAERWVYQITDNWDVSIERFSAKSASHRSCPTYPTRRMAIRAASHHLKVMKAEIVAAQKALRAASHHLKVMKAEIVAAQKALRALAARDGGA